MLPIAERIVNVMSKRERVNSNTSYLPYRLLTYFVFYISYVKKTVYSAIISDFLVDNISSSAQFHLYKNFILYDDIGFHLK